MDPEALYTHVIRQYTEHVNPGFARLVSFAGFGVEERAEGCYIWDHEGRKFLDCLGGYGVFALGHRHPRVVQAVKGQLDRMALSGKAFFSQPVGELATRLAEVAPRGLQYSFLCNSGAEAVEGAIKFAKAVTGRHAIVSTHGSFHGKTTGALAVSGRDKYRKPFGPLLPHVRFVDFGDAAEAEAAIDDQTAAFIVEPIQGEGGIIIPPDGYLASLRRACDRAGALLIADEVQTGLGRTGHLFGCDHEGVSPDIMTLAKSLGGGVMPIGVVMGTERVWEGVFGPNPLIHTSTFGGSELACVAGIETLNVIRDEGLVERSRRMGATMLDALKQVAAKHSDIVQEVRGRGLMIGLEFALDEVGELAVAQMMKRGLCVAYTLNNPRVLRFEPPLIIETDEVAFAADTLDAAISETKELLSELV